MAGGGISTGRIIDGRDNANATLIPEAGYLAHREKQRHRFWNGCGKL